MTTKFQPQKNFLLHFILPAFTMATSCGISANTTQQSWTTDLLPPQSLQQPQIAQPQIAQAQPSQNSPAEIIFIRHAEKPEVGDDLNDKGNQRAQLLTKYFTTNKDVTKFGTPAAIYAMGRATPTMGSLRPLETVTPLATSLGISVNSNYKKNDYQAMAQEILSKPEYFGKMVLICWEHNILPQVVDAFGYTAAPQSWPGSPYFNRTWVLDFTNGKPTSFRDFNQQLFPDDE